MCRSTTSGSRSLCFLHHLVPVALVGALAQSALAGAASTPVDIHITGTVDTGGGPQNGNAEGVVNFNTTSYSGTTQSVTYSGSLSPAAVQRGAIPCAIALKILLWFPTPAEGATVPPSPPPPPPLPPTVASVTSDMWSGTFSVTSPRLNVTGSYVRTPTDFTMTYTMTTDLPLIEQMSWVGSVFPTGPGAAGGTAAISTALADETNYNFSMGVALNLGGQTLPFNEGAIGSVNLTNGATTTFSGSTNMSAGPGVASAIPTLSEWGLISMGIAFLAFGGVVARRMVV